MKRFYVIDAMRCVLALCVAIGHIGVFPLFGSVAEQYGIWSVLARGLRTTVFGPPAVIAFFVISGFCIHYPFSNGAQFPVLNFYARRYLRIITPLIALLVLFKLAIPGTVIVGKDSILWHSTLWSLVCEEFYYAAYPALFALALRVGWLNILAGGFCISLVVIACTYPAVEWQDIGIIATTIILFPVWLLGCHLASNIGTLKHKCSSLAIWLWRLAAWFTMWAALILHFHTSIHQTMNGVVVGVICSFWLRAEISCYDAKMPWRMLVRAGRWSYSLYLIHPLVTAVCIYYGLVSFDTRAGWLIGFALVLAGSYGFYLAVERPSHRFARRMFPLARYEVGDRPVYVES